MYILLKEGDFLLQKSNHWKNWINQFKRTVFHYASNVKEKKGWFADGLDSNENQNHQETFIKQLINVLKDGRLTILIVVSSAWKR